MSWERLRLVGSELKGVVSADDGRGELEAEFFVSAQPVGRTCVGTFKLLTMTASRYEAWYLETLEIGLAEGEVQPLVVPPAVLAVQGLVEHVTREYLDPEDPDRINVIRSCLEGPLHIDNNPPNGLTLCVPSV